MAGTAVLTTLLVLLAGTAQHDELAYRPSQPMGSLSVRVSGSPADEDPTGTRAGAHLADIVRGAAPGLAVSPTWQVGTRP